jgi:hypothetical protein
MHELLDTPWGKMLGLERSGATFLKRAIALCLHNPRVLKTFLYEGYRNLLGVSLDRRSHPGLSGLPIEVILDLTRRCNLRCQMCTQIRHSKNIPSQLSWYNPERELPLDGWVDLLDQMTSFRPRLHITGGEPLVYPHFPELVRENKKSGLLPASDHQRHLALQCGRSAGILRGGSVGGFPGRPAAGARPYSGAIGSI